MKLKIRHKRRNAEALEVILDTENKTATFNDKDGEYDFIFDIKKDNWKAMEILIKGNGFDVIDAADKD